jgi:hypothetical protein
VGLTVSDLKAYCVPSTTGILICSKNIQLILLRYSVYWSIEVHLKTSPLTPLLAKERGDEAQLYRGEVELYLSCLRIRYS